MHPMFVTLFIETDAGDLLDPGAGQEAPRARGQARNDREIQCLRDGEPIMTTHLSPARTPSAQGQNEDPHRSLHTRTGARPGEPHVAVAAIKALREAGNEIDLAALRGLIKGNELVTAGFPREGGF